VPEDERKLNAVNLMNEGNGQQILLPATSRYG
jgi:hypothetical protein